MSTGQILYVPPKTRSWATSAVILGVLFTLTSLPSLFQYSKTVAMFGSAKATISIILSAVSAIVAISFVVTGALTLKGSASGREGLSYTGAIAAVLNVLSSLWGWIIFHDPAYVNIMNRMGGGGSSLPPSFFSNLLTGMSIALVVIGLLQMTYCIAIYRHMSAEPVEPPMSPRPPVYESGAWPPPPSQ